MDLKGIPTGTDRPEKCSAPLRALVVEVGRDETDDA